MRSWGTTAAGLVALAIACAAMGASSPRDASAQQAPSAAAVAAWVDARYGRSGTASARFVHGSVSAGNRTSRVSRGRARFRRPDRMRFDRDDGSVHVSDGQTVIAYEPPARGKAHGQYSQRPAAAARLPAALAFLTSPAPIARRHHVRLLPAHQLGFSGGRVLELRPIQPTPHYARIVLLVDDRPAERGLVLRVLIVHANGDRDRFDLTEQDLTTAVPDAVFAYLPPAGARRIEP